MSCGEQPDRMASRRRGCRGAGSGCLIGTLPTRVPSPQRRPMHVLWIDAATQQGGDPQVELQSARMAIIGSSGIEVSRLCLGANVFGWTADRDTSFAVLDAFTAAGGNFVDTADSYMWRVPGNAGGQSETIIGEWFARRGRRDDVVLATKVSSLPTRKGLAAANIAAACDDSLRRLQTDRIDLYYAHYDDRAVAQEEYLDAFDRLVRAGKVRAVAASNFTAERLRSALEISRRDGLAEFVALQPHYNLVERAEFETALLPVLE